MYTLSKNLRLTAFIFMAVGAILFAVDYYNLPSTTQEVAAMEAAHGGGHGGGHEAESATHDAGHGEAAAHGEKSSHSEDGHEMTPEQHNKHVLAQYQNKPWSAIYIASFFFFMIALACLAFYAIQYVAQAGWSPLLLRVMEGITSYLPVGSIIMLLLLIAGAFQFNHLFHWADPSLVEEGNAHYDKIIAGKSGWLNPTRFILFSVLYLLGWNVYRYFALKFSKNQDESTDNKWHKKSFKAAAMFLVFFIYTESMMSWDWIMALDPHWFSTLFGWYVFAGMMVCAITTIALVTMVLKSQGYLKQVNDSHIHDLAKFMFAFSIFWTYLWFSQFMLIWYSNIPEEVTYFITRIEDYNLPFFAMLGMNFVFPLLLLMNSDFKRVNWFVVMAGIVILLGHYVDLFNMVMPATVGKSWSFGFVEIGSLLFFLGLFIFVVFRSLTKRPLEPKRNPLIEESKHFHY